MRDTVEMFADRAGFPAERKYDLITATGEAAMNAIVHGGEGTAVFSASEDSIMVRIQDTGPGIEIDRIPQATLERGYTTAGSFGHGFKLMLKMIDRLWLLTGQEGTTVILEQSRHESQPDWFKALLDSNPDDDPKGA
jgi:anti-sigma regulatory factor (Ser/Thr protein kinase)